MGCLRCREWAAGSLFGTVFRRPFFGRSWEPCMRWTAAAYFGDALGCESSTGPHIIFGLGGLRALPFCCMLSVPALRCVAHATILSISGLLVPYRPQNAMLIVLPPGTCGARGFVRNPAQRPSTRRVRCSGRISKRECMRDTYTPHLNELVPCPLSPSAPREGADESGPKSLTR